ncbi:MAG: hypothetical protein IJK52_04655, partial [Oscillospiraceae bacterium]|nr:hypothetical protein [Oscillospiraceae bacterium]
VYDRMGYQYLAASFDGAGWLPSGKKDREALEAEIVAMTNPVREALEKDPDFFCGQIIFQKDGYNMSRRTPVAWGLPLQLEILHQYGYQVVTVAELMEECPFADVGRDNPLFEKMARLAKRRGVAYSDNKLRLENHMTMGELAMLLAPIDEALDLRWAKMRRAKRRVHPYFGALAWCSRERILPRNVKADAPVTELPHGIFDDTKTYTRRAVYEAFREDWLDQGEYQEREIERIREQLRSTWTPPALPLPSAHDAEAKVESVTDAPQVIVTEAPKEVPQIAETAESVAEAETVTETAEEITEPETPQEVEETVTEAETETPEEIADVAENAETVTEADAPEAVTEPETPQEVAEPVTDTDAPEVVAAFATEIAVPETAETHVETTEEIYERALAEVYTEDSGDAHKIMNLPHVEDIPHVDGIPVIEYHPENLDDLFPEDTNDAQ